MKIKIFNTSFLNFKNQCYLVYDNFIGILIDPSWNYSLINNFLKYNNIILKAVLLTHSHFDHTNLANKFSKVYNVPVYMSQIEIDFFNFNCKNLVGILHLETLHLSNIKIQNISTPGHTIGSSSFLIDNHLFTGDSIFIEGVGLCDLKSGDPHQMYTSVQFLKEYLNENTCFWPGHSYGKEPGKSMVFLLKNNIYFQFTTAESFVKFRMRKKSSFYI